MKDIVELDRFGVVEVLDQTLCERVGAGILDAELKANAICQSEVNTNCHGSNGGCLLSPNTACGSNTFCTETHI